MVKKELGREYVHVYVWDVKQMSKMERVWGRREIKSARFKKEMERYDHHIRPHTTTSNDQMLRDYSSNNSSSNRSSGSSSSSSQQTDYNIEYTEYSI